jgi:hypothetical protein
MTKRVLSLVVLLLTAAPGFASSSPRSFAAQRQFQLQPPAGRSRHSFASPVEPRSNGLRRGPGPVPAAQTPQHPHKYANPPVTSVGFVAASQIPAGGALTFGVPAFPGDFNGDGKKDVLTITKNSSGIYSVSVALGNGDGTFKAPVLTAVPGNAYDAFVVGDLNNDGIDDVVILHQTVSSTLANLDVLLGTSTGAFTIGGNYVITSGMLAGGILFDSNADGELDLLAVDSGNPGTLWTLLGNNDGTFGVATPTLLPGQAGGNLVFGDFNGDGLLDIADNDFTSGQLTVYLAATATSFANGVASTTSNAVYDACSNAIGDLNGDGHPEIVSANCSDNNLTIYVNDGTGKFAPGVYYNAAVANSASNVPYLGPQALAIADVNGDGHGDIVATNYFAGDVTVLLGNGDGTVNVPTFGYTTGGFPSPPAVIGDFNGDGLLDILVPDGVYSFSYMKGYGDGTFRAALDFYAPVTDNLEAFGLDLATGDFNGDGFPDVVVGNCCDATVGITVFLSNSDGTLQPGVNYGTGGNWNYVTVADFNKDGKLDIAALDIATGQIQIYTGDGTGAFTAGPTALTGDTSSLTLTSGDFNGDGYADIAVANNASHTVGVFLNDKHGSLLAPANQALTGAPAEVLTADVNGDGKLDLLALQAACGCVAVMLGNGDGTFTPDTVASDACIASFASHVAVGDLNNDGKPDLVITIDDFTNGHGIQVALGNGDGTFAAASAVFPTTLQSNFFFAPSPTYVKLADLDGDGNLDAVYSNSNYSTVGVMYGNGTGTFFDPVEYPTADGSRGLALADVNSDGAVDVVTANYYTAGAAVLLNNSGSKTTADYDVAANPTTAMVSAGAAGTYTVTLTPRNFYNGTVTFTCGTLPTETTCAFSSPTLSPVGNGAMMITLTLQTTAATAAFVHAPARFDRRGSGPLFASLSSIGLFGLLLAGTWKSKKSRRAGIIFLALALGMIVLLVACGGSGTPVNNPPPNPGTTPGTYTVAVTATGTAGTTNGNIAPHTFNVMLTVQ